MIITTSKDDLKNRIFGESNSLKQYILANERGSSITRDDVLIHDGQVASSTTFNIVLLNFLTATRDAIYAKQDVSATQTSYFQVVRDMSELYDATRLLLKVNEDEGTASFVQIRLQLKCDTVSKDIGDRLVSVGDLWYGINRHSDDVEYDEFNLVAGMNEENDTGRYGVNPFEKCPRLYNGGIESDGYVDDFGDETNTFNSFLKANGVCILNNCIVENVFKGSSTMRDHSAQSVVARILLNSEYLVCTSIGLLGLQAVSDSDGNFARFDIWRLSEVIPSIVPLSTSKSVNDEYEFSHCNFSVVDDEVNLLIVLKDRAGIEQSDDGEEDTKFKYRYLFINESGFDSIYGVGQITKLTSEGAVYDPMDVFDEPNTFKTLGNNSVILTSNGFWDIEPNETNDVVYGYTGSRTLTRSTSNTMASARADKLSKPTYSGQDDEVMVQYDMPIRKSGNDYVCSGHPDRPINLTGTSDISYLGGNDEFGLYAKDGEGCLKLMVNINSSEFNYLLFSDSDLTTTFIDWLYDSCTQTSKGEYWLQGMHGDYSGYLNSRISERATHTGVSYCPTGESGDTRFSSAIGTRFDTTVNGYVNSSTRTLQGYCSALNNLLNTGISFSRIIDESVLKDEMAEYFRQYWNGGISDAEASECVQELIKKYPLLSHFTTFLNQEVESNLSSIIGSTVTVDSDSKQKIQKNVVSYIRNMVGNSLMLGGYDSGKSGNDCYPGISAYFQQRDKGITRTSVEYIMSTSNAYSEIVDAVRTCPFFSGMDSYSDFPSTGTTKEHFKIDSSMMLFPHLSKVSDESGYIDVNWSDIQTFLRGQIDQNKVLSSFITTQFYRPLFFKHDGYLTHFSSDETKYKCFTSKKYERYDGVVHGLSIASDYSVNESESGLDDSHIVDVAFRPQMNVLLYSVLSDRIYIVDNKFVYNDIEYYVVPDKSGRDRIMSMYFNDFIVESSIQKLVEVSNGKFTLDGVEYTIVTVSEDGVTKTMLTMDQSQSFNPEFKMEVVDSRFTIDGVHYVIQTTSSGTYVKYESHDERTLRRLYVSYDSETGTANCDDEIEFVFSGSSSVVVKTNYKANVIDSVTEEWSCAESELSTIDEDRTFEYQLYRVVSNFMKKNPSMAGCVSNLNGNIYDGVMDTKVTLEPLNSIVDGCATTEVVMKYYVDGVEQKEELGTIIDETGNVVDDKTVIGSLDSDGLVVDSSSASSVLVFKKISDGWNCVNAIVVNKASWNSQMRYESVGTYTISQIGEGTPITLPNGETATITKLDSDTFKVELSQADGQYMTLNTVNDSFFGFVDSSNVRYQVSISGENYVLSRLAFTGMAGTTCDFGTDHDFTSLSNSFFSNVQQMVLNSIVQKMIDSDGSQEQEVDVTPSVAPLSTYVDILPDQFTLDCFQKCRGFDSDSDEYAKFKEVFKNNVVEVDQDNMEDGAVYGYLRGLMDRAFGSGDRISVSGEPSISVSRVSQVDEFTYSVLADLTMRCGRKTISASETGYVLGDITVHDIEIEVKITPKWSDSGIKCDVLYTISGQGSASVSYSSRITSNDGKVRTRVLVNPIYISGASFDGWSVSYSDRDISEIKEWLGNIVGSLDQDDVMNQIFPQERISALFSKFNNMVSDKVNVSATTTKNEGCDDGIWSLSSTSTPSGAIAGLTSRGYAKIDGNVYVLSDDQTTLNPVSDGAVYKVQKFNDTYYVIGKEDTVSNSYLSSYFSLRPCGSSKVLVLSSKILPVYTVESEVAGTGISSKVLKMNGDTEQVTLGKDFQDEAWDNQFTVTLTPEQVAAGDDVTTTANVSITSTYSSSKSPLQVVVHNVGTDDVSIEIVDTKQTYQMADSIPDETDKVVSLYSYSPSQAGSVDIGSDDDGNTVLSFYVKMARTESELMFCPTSASQNYLTEDGVFVSYSGSSSAIAEYGFRAVDVNGDDVDVSLGYGIAYAPINVQSVSDISELNYRNLYFTVSGNTISSGGRIAKFQPNVLSYTGEWSSERDIYDRYYVTGEQVPVDRKSLSSSDLDGSLVWNDRGSTRKSLRFRVTDDETWRTLLGSSCPSSIQQKISELKENSIKVAKSDIQSPLLNLHQFLSSIYSELNTNLSKETVRGMCDFLFDIDLSFMTYYDTYKSSTGVFRKHQALEEEYSSGLEQMNAMLKSDFSCDFTSLSVSVSDEDIVGRDYYYILTKNTVKQITALRDEKLNELFNCCGKFHNTEDAIYQMFGSENSLRARYLNVVDTSVDCRSETVKWVYLIDRMFNVFTKNDSGWRWYQFDATSTLGGNLVQKKRENVEYVYTPERKILDLFSMDGSSDNILVFLNRDFTSKYKTRVQDAYAIRCVDGTSKMFWISSLDCYVYTKAETDSDTIVDMAYEQEGDHLYVIYGGDDNYVYRYDSISSMCDSQKRVLLKKANATMKLDTALSRIITQCEYGNKWILLDYSDPSDGSEIPSWTMDIYGLLDGKTVQETWAGSPGARDKKFSQTNTMIIGDNLFDASQYVFHNIAKNKSMMSMVDVEDVDGNYYGLFEDSEAGSYVVFRTPDRSSTQTQERIGTVQRLPYNVVVPQMFKTADPVYSLYVVVREFDEDNVGTYSLREISVPESDIYVNRTIDIQSILDQGLTDGQSRTSDISRLEMGGFKTDTNRSSFFVVTERGLQKVRYEADYDQDSFINTKSAFTSYLKEVLQKDVFDEHVAKEHDGNPFFASIQGKMNQYSDDFSIFNLIPTEFSQTQIVGLVPDSAIDDDDDSTDHRPDSIQSSTDVFPTEGMTVDSSSNPGLITAAVSNPATIYDEDDVFTKSQRNPSISGTEFYDFIYDQDGNTVLDLYAISYIYQIHTNNTYDLYINIPTTRTKYLNRIAGTLKDDLTTQVQAGDSRTRVNFQTEDAIPNNLDDSTTHLRIYIDRKFISVGNIELLEICGNSIPAQIYREDSANSGLYDSIALESRWDGEFNEILDTTNDINKVMLEFEVYGTDSQSIHISGKSLINPYLDDGKYDFSE